MPQLKPETISMTGLNLFQHLCNLARLATSTLESASSCEVLRPFLFLPSSSSSRTLDLSTYSCSQTDNNNKSCLCRPQLCGMDQLWGIALRAQSADISRAAIQYINSYYINGQ